MPSPNPKVDGALRGLADLLSQLKPAEVSEVFDALLTPPEREKIALRWKLVCLLEKGETQRHIASELGISLCKITRGSHELKYGPAGFRKAIRKAVSKG